jgi:leucyl/phenylalanyl-tRNA--protein transferase
MASHSEKVLGQVQKGRALLRHLRLGVPAKLQRLLGSVSTQLTDNPYIGLCGVNDRMPLTAEEMIFAYSQGLFPMDAGGKLRWQCPEPRFVLYLDQLRLSANMRRDLRKSSFTHTFDRQPRAVLDACAQGRSEHWLSERLKSLYLELFELGVMHTIETWSDGVLVGGSFGMAMGRVFTGETMFHRAPGAGKACFVQLASHLRERGFLCIDAQWPTDDMLRFGAREVPMREYRKLLARGLVNAAEFHEPSRPEASVLRRVEPERGR